MPRIPPDVREAILADLRQGVQRKFIALKHDVSPVAVSRIGIKAGLRHHERKVLLTPEQSEDVLARYATGQSTLVIAKAYGVAESTIQLTLRRAGVPARSYVEAGIRHSARHDALDVLTADAAYWCGFLFADGAVQIRPKGKGSPLVSLTLKEPDRGHLVKFRDFLGSTHAITAGRRPRNITIGASHGRTAGESRFCLASQQLAERLLALGRYGPIVDPELAVSRDFWRGVADGDGTICISGGIPVFRLYGEEWLLKAFVEFLGPLAHKPGRRPVRVRPCSSIYVVSTSYRTAENIVDLLYTDATTALDRKAVLAGRVLANRAQRLSVA